MAGDFMELQILTLILEGIAGAAISYVGWKLKKIRESEEEIKRREKDFEELELLNTKMILIRECNRYIDKGFAPVYAKSSIADIWNKYHLLGGNGGIESLYLEFRGLPTTEASK